MFHGAIFLIVEEIGNQNRGIPEQKKRNLQHWYSTLFERKPKASVPFRERLRKNGINTVPIHYQIIKLIYTVFNRWYRIAKKQVTDNLTFD
jgi:hypothetical protein